MSRTIRNEDHGTFAYSAGWTLLGSSGLWGSTPTTPATSGTVKFSSTAGSTCTITLPAHHGFTGCAIIGHGASTNNPNATIALDGVLQQTWNQKFGTAAGANYYLPRLLSLPIFLTDTASTQVIVITVGNGGGNLIIDGIELYAAEAQTAGRLTSFGHSMLYGISAGNVWTTQAGRFTKLFADTLSAQNYLGSSSWTDDNQGVPGEDLINGSYWSGNSPALPQFVNTRFFNQATIQVPGWMRAEAGELWPNPAPGVGPAGNIGSGWTVAGNYYPGVAQWWASKFAVGLFMHGFNDRSLYTIYDAGTSTLLTGSNANTGFLDAASHTTAPAAGSGYTMEMYKQRIREAIIRPMLNITPVPRMYFLGTPNTNNGLPVVSPETTYQQMTDAALAAVLSESWVQNAFFVPLYAATTGVGPVSVAGSPFDVHPNTLGHSAINEALRQFHDRTGVMSSGIGGGRL